MLSKLGIYVIVIIVILTAIGGFFTYHYFQVSSLQSALDKKNNEITGLKSTVELLKVSNKSLESELTRKEQEAGLIREEIGQLRQKDIQSQDRLNALRQQLNDLERAKRVAAIRESRKAELLARLTNKNIRCLIENIDRIDGKCIRGQFVPDGERLVPRNEGDE